MIVFVDYVGRRAPGRNYNGPKGVSADNLHVSDDDGFASDASPQLAKWVIHFTARRALDLGNHSRVCVARHGRSSYVPATAPGGTYPSLTPEALTYLPFGWLPVTGNAGTTPPAWSGETAAQRTRAVKWITHLANPRACSPTEREASITIRKGPCQSRVAALDREEPPLPSFTSYVRDSQ